MSRKRRGKRNSQLDQAVAVSAVLMAALFLLPMVVVAPFQNALFGREEPVDESEQKKEESLPPFVSGDLDAARALRVLEMDLGT